MRVKKLIPILLIMLMFVSLTACGSGSGGGYTEDEQVQSEEATTTSSGKARVEMDEYEYYVEAPEDTTVHGTISKSYGQDIVVMRLDNEEVARITLDGNDGGEESFSIVIPAEEITKEHNKFRIMGDEKSGVIDATNTKLFTIVMR